MPKIIDHDQRRREIVEVARSLIIEGGFETATMRSIAAAAGFANGALKHYFPSKDSIVAATFESVLVGMETRLLPPEQPPGPVEALRSLVELALPLDKQRIDSARVLLALWERAMNNQELAALYIEHMTRWRGNVARQIAAARQAGEPVDAPAVAVRADELIAASIGANVASVLFPDGSMIPRYRAYVDEFMERVVDGPVRTQAQER